jgi:hypothetical protein
MSITSRLKSLIAKRLGKYPEDIGLSSLARNFKNDYGYLASVKAQKPIDFYGRPIPWFTYPAIEYLESLNLSNANIFEWGSGNSSAYFSERCLSIESIETDDQWYEYQLEIAKPNQVVHLRHEASDDYHLAINEGQHIAYDIIIIDGKQRVRCCSEAIAKLDRGGLLILDNSDWYPRLCESLRKKNFVQIDFHGHGPINPYTWTTSLFMPCIDTRCSENLLFRKSPKPYFSKSGLIQAAQDDGPIKSSID